MLIFRDEKELEKLRCEFEATLLILVARVSTAVDQEDWHTIEKQVRQSLTIAGKAKREASKPSR